MKKEEYDKLSEFEKFKYMYNNCNGGIDHIAIKLAVCQIELLPSNSVTDEFILKKVEEYMMHIGIDNGKFIYHYQYAVVAMEKFMEYLNSMISLKEARSNDKTIS